MFCSDSADHDRWIGDVAQQTVTLASAGPALCDLQRLVCFTQSSRFVLVAYLDRGAAVDTSAGRGRDNPRSLAPPARFLSRWRLLTSRVERLELGFRGHLWPIAAVVLGLLVCAQAAKPGSRHWMDAHFDARHFPVQASEVIVQRGIREPIFAPDSWGGYLIYRLYPQNKVFVDDRHDLYGEEFLKEYLKAIRLTPDWDGFLEKKKVNWALLPAESSLANMLRETSQWIWFIRMELQYCWSEEKKCSEGFLESIVGVDVESEDGVDLDRFISAQRGTELPAVERGQDFAGHDCRGGFEHLRPAEQIRCGRGRMRSPAAPWVVLQAVRSAWLGAR